MKDDTFDKLLATLSNQLHVTQIMSTKPDFCTKSDNPLTILETMHRRNYDIMPVKENGKFVGYVERDILVKLKQIEPAIQQINLDIVVSAGTCVHEMIDLFQKSRFFFVNRANDLVGLVTYADLDKIPVRVWLFILICKFEFLLLQLIKNFYEGSLWLNKLTAKRRKKITDLFDEKRKHDIDISLENCLNLGDMIELLESDRKLRSFIGYTSRNSCKRECSGLDVLRNNVMHPSTSLVNNYDGVVLSKRKNRLQQATKRIESALKNF